MLDAKTAREISNDTFERNIWSRIKDNASGGISYAYFGNGEVNAKLIGKLVLGGKHV